MRDVLTMKEVAERLGIALNTVRNLVSAGELPSIRISPRRIVIPLKSFELWLESRVKQHQAGA